MKYKLMISLIMVAIIVLSMVMVLPVNGNSTSYTPNGANESSSINNTIGTHFKNEHNYGAKLKYNSSTGMISGQYLHAKFKNGVFTNLTDNQTSTTLISKMYANGTSVFKLPNFLKSNQHLLINNGTYTMGNLFLHMNTTSFFALHNNPSIETNIAVHDGELYLNIPSSATIYNTTNNTQVNTSADAKFNANINSSMFSKVSTSTKMMLDLNNHISAGRKMIMIDNNGTVAMIFVHNGNFVIKHNMITISSSHTAMVSIVAPPGLQNMSHSKMVMKNIFNGKISAEAALNLVNGTMTNSTINYNSSIGLKYAKGTSTTNTFNVNSTAHHSTIISIFIGKNATKDTGHAFVKFDGSTITEVSLSTLVNETSTSKAYYSDVNTSSGMYVFVYVPHFSNHTVEVSNTAYPTIPNVTEYYVIGGIIGVIAIIGIAAVVIKKRK